MSLSYWLQKRLGTASRVAGFLLTALVAATVSAQVIEIGDDGVVTRHDGPALYLSPDLRPRPIRLIEPSVARTADIPIESLLAASAGAHGVSAALVHAVAWHESRLRPGVVSSKGAIGVMQLMPATARFLRVDPYDPAANIEGGVTFLANLLRRYDGDLVRTLAAYDAGPAAVDRFGGLPPFRETRAYVASILATLAGGGAQR